MTTDRSDLGKNLTAGISAHSAWKRRLRDAIQGGASIDPAVAERDDACELGKWLAANAQMRSDPNYGKVCELHRSFHKEVGGILRESLAGGKEKAAQRLESGSPYTKISSELVLAMAKWQRNA